MSVIVQRTCIGRLAQLVRAFASHAKGHRFEPCIAHIMKLIERIIQEIETIFLEINSCVSTIPPSVSNSVPYRSQFASPEFAEEILRKGASKASDPRWKDTGADSLEEYAQWVSAQCGMACASMALSHAYGDVPPIVHLGRSALKEGVYEKEGGVISDMRYRKFALWAGKRGLAARVFSRLSMRGIRFLLSSGYLVMASVNPNIRGYETAPKVQKGGHLVLLTGYDTRRRTITLHNPSGFVSLGSQENHEVGEDSFSDYYAGRGIALRKSS